MSPTPESPNYAATAQQWLTQHDPFSAWLGVVLEEVRPGYCRLRLPVRPEMLNGFGLVHGGITFAAADTAFSIACNTHGRQSVGLGATIDYLEPGRPGDNIIIEAEEMGLKQRIGVYEVRIHNQDGLRLALFKGTAYRTSQENKLLADN
ncbi:PaaI family thioesterase [Hymenobacter psoromatis]|uniref:PaaI family thioesterase n=1 Tax=Hymenobacter psoromatis TaxID=1484116 RepID=UPI001CC11448|nr:hotdog fold thioesterase [Hymenobacter psoromatis]